MGASEAQRLPSDSFLNLNDALAGERDHPLGFASSAPTYTSMTGFDGGSVIESCGNRPRLPASLRKNNFHLVLRVISIYMYIKVFFVGSPFAKASLIVIFPVMMERG